MNSTNVTVRETASDSLDLQLAERHARLGTAVIEGDVQLVKTLLADLSSQRRRKLLLTPFRRGKSVLQIALRSKNRDAVFRTLRVSMSKETKRSVALTRDKRGNNTLHDACRRSHPLLIVQQVLASFDKDERLQLITATDRMGKNCLRMAADSDNADIFHFLLTRLSSDHRMLHKCVFATLAESPLDSPLTVVQALLTQTTPNSYNMFMMILELMASQRFRLIFKQAGYLRLDNCLEAIRYRLNKRERLVPYKLMQDIIATRNQHGWTLIHMACLTATTYSFFRDVCNFKSLGKWFAGTYMNSILSLFKRVGVKIGVNISNLIQYGDYQGNTVIHIAVILNQPEVVSAVLRNLNPSAQKALLSQVNADGYRPSELCSSSDDRVTRYLAPLQSMGWRKEDTLKLQNKSRQLDMRVLLTDLEREQDALAHLNTRSRFEDLLELELQTLDVEELRRPATATGGVPAAAGTAPVARSGWDSTRIRQETGKLKQRYSQQYWERCQQRALRMNDIGQQFRRRYY